MDGNSSGPNVGTSKTPRISRGHTRIKGRSKRLVLQAFAERSETYVRYSETFNRHPGSTHKLGFEIAALLDRAIKDGMDFTDACIVVEAVSAICAMGAVEAGPLPTGGGGSGYEGGGFSVLDGGVEGGRGTDPT